MIVGSWRFSPVVAWYDLWIGVYYDRKGRALYLLPLPMIGIKISFGCKHIRWMEGVLKESPHAD